jgi:GcrA cell cycle regulator
MSDWTDDHVEQLKKLWEAGMSATQISNEMPGFSRNAVIGKVHRLGLAGRREKQRAAAMKPQRKPFLAQQRGTNLKTSAASLGNAALAEAYSADAYVERDPVGYDNVVPMNQRLTLPELTDATCKWPIGDPQNPEFFFCGGRALQGLPYCAHHSRIAYQPASDRRRGRPSR